MPYTTGPKPKEPMGVVPSPSRCEAESPFRPTCAFHGPATSRQHWPSRRQRRTAAVARERGGLNGDELLRMPRRRDAGHDGCEQSKH